MIVCNLHKEYDRKFCLSINMGTMSWSSLSLSYSLTKSVSHSLSLSLSLTLTHSTSMNFSISLNHILPPPATHTAAFSILQPTLSTPTATILLSILRTWHLPKTRHRHLVQNTLANTSLVQ